MQLPAYKFGKNPLENRRFGRGILRLEKAIFRIALVDCRERSRGEVACDRPAECFEHHGTQVLQKELPNEQLGRIASKRRVQILHHALSQHLPAKRLVDVDSAAEHGSHLTAESSTMTMKIRAEASRAKLTDGVIHEAQHNVVKLLLHWVVPGANKAERSRRRVTQLLGGLRDAPEHRSLYLFELIIPQFFPYSL